MYKKGIVLIILFLVNACQLSNETSQIKTGQSIIDAVQHKLLPDKRDHIFAVKLYDQQGQIVLKGQTDYKILKQTLLSEFRHKGLNVIDSIQLLPEVKLKDLIGITRLSVANLRARPKHAAELVTQTLMGMPLQIFEEKNGFFHVKTPAGYYAWIDRAGLVILDKKIFSAWLKQPKIIVTAPCGRILSEPFTDALPVSDFVLNDVFSLGQRQERYTLIAYPDGRKGYIPSDDFMLLNQFEATNKSEASTEDLLHYARQYMGIPYLWGGTSIKGLDCSGFTKNVFAQVGYALPRDASQQVKIGKPIKITSDFSNLKPGDLLFFGHKIKGKDKITHVALHLGQGRIIHATGEVKIESLNSNDQDYNEARFKTLLQARRIFGVIKPTFAQYYTPDYWTIK